MIFNPAVINLIKKEDEQLNIDSLFSLIQSVVFFFFYCISTIVEKHSMEKGNDCYAKRKERWICNKTISRLLHVASKYDTVN